MSNGNPKTIIFGCNGFQPDNDIDNNDCHHNDFNLGIKINNNTSNNIEECLMIVDGVL